MCFRDLVGHRSRSSSHGAAAKENKKITAEAQSAQSFMFSNFFLSSTPPR
jgi:hypothetical protein